MKEKKLSEAHLIELCKNIRSKMIAPDCASYPPLGYGKILLPIKKCKKLQ